MHYEIYPRTVGGKNYFYYEYYDLAGRRVRKSTGCTKKSDAVAFLNSLEFAAEQKKKNSGRTTFEVYTAGFFADSGMILSRWKSHGKILKDRTLRCHRLYLDKYLSAWFTGVYLEDITAKLLDSHLINVKQIGSYHAKRNLSGSSKNNIKDTLTIILKEALFDEMITTIPSFKVYARNSKRQNTLTDKELQLLFPFDQEAAGPIWRNLIDGNDSSIGLMFEVMAGIAVSCGLRSGEIVALSYEQIIAGKGLVVDRELDDKGNVCFPKKGTESDPRYRVVPISDYTFMLLERWFAVRGRGPGFLFTYHGKAVTAGYLLARFKRALAAAKIDTTNRSITFHGLRYTFNTKMKNVIPREMLRDIIGHKTEEMTDLYVRPVLEERLDEYLSQILPAVKGFWKKVQY